MHRTISGLFNGENSFSPVVFLPGYRIRYGSGVINISKDAPLSGQPWPGSARIRRIFLALEENQFGSMPLVVPPAFPKKAGEKALELEIRLTAPRENVQWGFGFDSGIMKVFDGKGLEIEFSGEREKTETFLFQGRGIGNVELRSGEWKLEEQEGVFRCSAASASGSSFDGQKSWLAAAEKKHAWWHEAFLFSKQLPPLPENRCAELLEAVHQMLMYPEELFFFDGNFSSWCRGMRKLRFGELLKTRLLQICRLSNVWNYNAKCFSGIDDGIRLPRRSDLQGNPLEFDWLNALDSSSSCLVGIEMFEYCNELHDIEFLKKHAFGFMRQVMQVVELLIVPENFKLALPCGPHPGAKGDSALSCGKNVDRQLYLIHLLAEKLLKASDLLGRRPDPVWRDIAERLPKARGKWHPAPDTVWGMAGEKVCQMVN